MVDLAGKGKAALVGSLLTGGLGIAGASYSGLSHQMDSILKTQDADYELVKSAFERQRDLIMAEVAGDMELIKGLEGSGLFIFFDKMLKKFLGDEFSLSNLMGLDAARERVQAAQDRVNLVRDEMQDNLQSYNIPLDGWGQTVAAIRAGLGLEEDETILGTFGKSIVLPTAVTVGGLWGAKKLYDSYKGNGERLIGGGDTSRKKNLTLADLERAGHSPGAASELDSPNDRNSKRNKTPRFSFTKAGALKAGISALFGGGLVASIFYSDSASAVETLDTTTNDAVLDTVTGEVTMNDNVTTNAEVTLNADEGIVDSVVNLHADLVDEMSYAFDTSTWTAEDAWSNVAHPFIDGVVVRGITGGLSYAAGGLIDLADYAAESLGGNLVDQDNLRDTFQNNTVGFVRQGTGTPELTSTWSKTLNEAGAWLSPAVVLKGAKLLNLFSKGADTASDVNRTSRVTQATAGSAGLFMAPTPAM